MDNKKEEVVLEKIKTTNNELRDITRRLRKSVREFQQKILPLIGVHEFKRIYGYAPKDYCFECRRYLKWDDRYDPDCPDCLNIFESKWF